MDDIYLATFDPGRKNFAFCVEKCSREQLECIKNIAPHQRYEHDGTPTDEMRNILDQVYMNGKIVLHKNVDLTVGCDSKGLEQRVFNNMTRVLEENGGVWDKCSHFLIEMQMSFGQKMNLVALKLAQHIYSYFIIRYGMTKKIVDFPAYHKTQILGAPKIEGKLSKSGKTRYKAMSKPHRKKWAIEQSVEILTTRGEDDILNNLQMKKKKDDMSDCLLMCQAGKYLYFVDNRLV